VAVVAALTVRQFWKILEGSGAQPYNETVVQRRVTFEFNDENSAQLERFLKNWSVQKPRECLSGLVKHSDSSTIRIIEIVVVK
jgi:hypothetical protein